MHVIGRVKLERPVILAAGDEMTLNYVEIDGVVRHERSVIFAVLKPDRGIMVDEAVLFETNHDGRYALGAMLLESKSKPNIAAMKISPKLNDPIRKLIPAANRSTQ